MTAFKRKKDDGSDDNDAVAGGAAANHINMTKLVIVNNHEDNNDSDNGQDKENSNDNMSVTATLNRIQQLRETWQPNVPDFGGSVGVGGNGNISQFIPEQIDPITQSIIASMMIQQKDDDDAELKLLEQSEQIQMKLSQDIEQAKALCNRESTALMQMASELAKFQQQRQALLDEIDDLDQRQRTAQSNIAQYQEEASQELDVVSGIEEEKKRQVPRLKASISLYAVTTGIKWDFEDPDLLAGYVDIPSQHGFKLFAIDPRDYTPVETADKLWDLMEGENTDQVRETTAV